MKKVVGFLMTAMLIPGCERNHKPAISGVICDPDSKSAGTTFTFEVTASDEDGDKLQYTWSADGGEFPDSTNMRVVKWISPITGTGKAYSIKIVVSDGINEVFREMQILLEAPELGNLAGQVNFTRFAIPISEVTVIVGDKTATTDENGYFFIPGIPIGDNILKTAKQDFPPYSAAIKIARDDTLKVRIEIASEKFSTKLSGIVSDQDGLPLENVLVVALNPDGSESNLKSSTNSAGYYKLWYIPLGERTILVRKSSTEEFGFVELKKSTVFTEMETQLNLTIQKSALHGRFTDSRDDHIYRYKTIGTQTWMAENLAYLPLVYPSSKSSVTEALYYVYGYQDTDTWHAQATAIYKLYGVLYNWVAAKSACSPGWHLPAAEEWSTLAKSLGVQAGRKMKSASGWYDHGNGDNSSGLSVFPGGLMDADGAFKKMDEAAYFWTSTIYQQRSIFCEGLFYLADELLGIPGSEIQGFSIRCVKNN